MIGLEHYLTVAAALFVIGIFRLFPGPRIRQRQTAFAPIVPHLTLPLKLTFMKPGRKP